MDNNNNAIGWEGLPPISKALYQETYFLPNETYEQWLYRITVPYENDSLHGNRIRDYIRRYYYHPSTPISSGRGLPIACYISHIEDSREGIFEGYFEGMWLGAEGGGRGVYWGDVGAAGRPIGISLDKLTTMTWSEIQADDNIPKSSGTIPFYAPSDRLTYSISQAGTRRSTEAVYTRIDHADIKDMIDIRLETGDPNRRMPNLHHGIAITDEFMHAVENLLSWDLKDPHTGRVTETVDAFDLWVDILITRKTETGEPFLLFIDTVNNNSAEEYQITGRTVKSTNICTEITLFTDKDTTAVCNLGSINLEYYDIYQPSLKQMIADISDFHDNVNTYFLEEIGKYTGMKAEAFRRARKAVYEERNIGIGVMGFHSLLQKSHIPFESPMAKALNMQIFKSIRNMSDEHQADLYEKYGDEIVCPLAREAGTHKRNIHSLAVAPTMSISNLACLASSGIEPWAANAFTKKLIQGSFSIKNKYLNYIINKHSLLENSDTRNQEQWVLEQWKSIIKHNGSAQHLEWLDEYSKDVYKTAFEINQLSVIGLAGDRQRLGLDQSQSLNIFLPSEVTYEELYAIHVSAWKQGVKSMYYLRSEPAITADTSTRERKAITLEDDDCVACT